LSGWVPSPEKEKKPFRNPTNQGKKKKKPAKKSTRVTLSREKGTFVPEKEHRHQSPYEGIETLLNLPQQFLFSSSEDIKSKRTLSDHKTRTRGFVGKRAA